MNRVVITGMGVIAANGQGLEAFRDALYLGKSRVRFSGELQKAHTLTKKDVKEIHNLQRVLHCDGNNFPWINSAKSLIGHKLGAADAIVKTSLDFEM